MRKEKRTNSKKNNSKTTFTSAYWKYHSILNNVNLLNESGTGGHSGKLRFSLEYVHGVFPFRLCSLVTIFRQVMSDSWAIRWPSCVPYTIVRNFCDHTSGGDAFRSISGSSLNWLSPYTIIRSWWVCEKIK